MRDLGAEIVDPADLPSGDVLFEEPGEFEVLLYEFKADLNAYLAERGDPAIRTLEDLIRFNEEHAEEELPYFGQELFYLAQEKGPLDDQVYLDALARNHRVSRGEGIDAVLGKDRLDALVAPTGSPAWKTDLVNGDLFLGGSSSASAMAGYPIVTVPAGSVYGLPVGINFMGTAYSEPTLIRLAYAFEQAGRAREVPAFCPGPSSRRPGPGAEDRGGRAGGDAGRCRRAARRRPSRGPPPRSRPSSPAPAPCLPATPEHSPLKNTVMNVAPPARIPAAIVSNLHRLPSVCGRSVTVIAPR
jgi:hypothetical protein